MQLCSGPRDRARWALLDTPLQIHPGWTMLCSFGLPLFTCQLRRCVFGIPQTSSAALRCIGVENTRTPPHCTICGEFLGKEFHARIFSRLQRILGFPCPPCMKHATDTQVQPSAVLHCPLVQVRTLAFRWTCNTPIHCHAERRMWPLAPRTLSPHGQQRPPQGKLSLWLPQ
jgi:hypothetical protein